MASTPSNFEFNPTLPPLQNPGPVCAYEVRRKRAPRTSAFGQADDELASVARGLAQSWKGVPAREGAAALALRWQRANRQITGILEQRQKAASDQAQTSRSARRLADYETLLKPALRDSLEAIRTGDVLEYVATSGGAAPRALDAMAAYLQAAHHDFGEATLLIFFTAFQEEVPFGIRELYMLRPFAQLALVEVACALAEAFDKDCDSSSICPDSARLAAVFSSLRRCASFDWNALVERVSVVDAILREDPAGAYALMDSESRDAYRQVIADLAEHSEWSEPRIARAAIGLARLPRPGLPERASERRSHVGFYFVDQGRSELQELVGYKLSLVSNLREVILRHPTISYLLSIGVIAFALIDRASGWFGHGWIRLLCLLLFLPLAIECATGITNLLAASLIRPRRLPRLEFSGGIPREHATFVVVPMLLTGVEQVRQAVKDLEVRYLANRDANLHFALLTDLPDSATPMDDKDSLVPLCSRLIRELNHRYRGQRYGGFFHFHRDRIFNPVEEIWMGWERKRGKLLDFNDLLLGKADNFPTKVGNLSVLPTVRYVITLDLDTQLPRDAARTLVGTLAHPLQRAVLDPARNVVVEGYGVLQPRVSITRESVAKSHLARLFSGDTGFDIYTRAISDPYQDLFGQAIFTGKGIYEVETVQTVLTRRFPSDTILSHDLIEGEYARTGLVSDVEVSDDYPSHVSAYSRRRHRWVRGDWQIVFWLLPRVPDYSGKLVQNPLRLISRWKILDNLRRSLTEVMAFILLSLGWILLPGNAIFRTLGILAVLSFPAICQLFLSVLRAGRTIARPAFWKHLAQDTASGLAALLFRLSLLCHQSLVMLDAVIRTSVRMAFTHKRLLQWETAAQAETVSHAGDPMEGYLNWPPLLALVIGTVIGAFHPSALPVALPFLLLWTASKPVCDWLNRAPGAAAPELGSQQGRALRDSALRTWRFFREFATAEDHWLIPDIVQEDPPQVAHRISPTNLGLLLNARQAACDLGFLTLPELAAMTADTLDTVKRMPLSHGHLYNWYDTTTLAPLPPLFVSSVDSGNLVCSLWTLKQGCIEASGRPLFARNLRAGLLDFVRVIEVMSREETEDAGLVAEIRDVRRNAESFLESGNCALFRRILEQASTLEGHARDEDLSSHLQWWTHELALRMERVEDLIRDFAPWLLPQFAGICHTLGVDSFLLPVELTLDTLPAAQAGIRRALRMALADGAPSEEQRAAMALLLSLLDRSGTVSRSFLNRLAEVAATAESLAEAMDFSVVYDWEHRLLSVGYDHKNDRLQDAHYDLLASEARVAAFVGVAKGEVPQEVWFRMGRPLTSYRDKNLLISWSGTMFEYLLPFLWMKLHPGTILGSSARMAVQVQKEFAAERSIPWGISESSCSERNSDGSYHYRAFGAAPIAINQEHAAELVVAPYSSFLALCIDRQGALANLGEMAQFGLLGAYGFYEACDFTSSRVQAGAKGEVVRCWMAHHQGMSLIAAANALCDSSMVRRFHAEPMVIATERLLEERFPRILKVEAPQPVEPIRRLLACEFPASAEKLGAST